MKNKYNIGDKVWFKCNVVDEIVDEDDYYYTGGEITGIEVTFCYDVTDSTGTTHTLTEKSVYTRSELVSYLLKLAYKK
ncbi:MAG: hypothetical protein FWG85_08165 [Bacteroidetes bacterium]|nr:hypothetical protein [Bacteroidota bacterium]